MNNRDIAIMLGRDTYIGRACKYGHTLRRVIDGNCQDCSILEHIAKRLPKPRNVAKSNANSLAYYHKNKERLDKTSKEWVQNNRARRNAWQRAYRKRNLDKPYYQSRTHQRHRAEALAKENNNES